MGNSLVAPLIPDILDTFDRSDAAAGPLVAAASLPGIVLAPVIGIAADRLGRRPVLATCLAIFGLAGIIVVNSREKKRIFLPTIDYYTTFEGNFSFSPRTTKIYSPAKATRSKGNYLRLPFITISLTISY